MVIPQILNTYKSWDDPPRTLSNLHSQPAGCNWVTLPPSQFSIGATMTMPRQSSLVDEEGWLVNLPTPTHVHPLEIRPY